MLKVRNLSKSITPVKPFKLQKGVALLESLIALLIFSMGILAIAGLQGFMIKGTTEAKNRSDASVIAQRRVAMMWSDAKATPAALQAAYEEVDTIVPELPNGLRSTTFDVAVADAVTIRVAWTTPGESQHFYTTNARIVGAR
ncbi:MAG: prepilin-type cleavage/methylation domain-containing protein [Methylotenera sp.]|nr:prepilin-type cleavage/methylation domain-containing protein [Methylotenera sp.]